MTLHILSDFLLAGGIPWLCHQRCDGPLKRAVGQKSTLLFCSPCSAPLLYPSSLWTDGTGGDLAGKNVLERVAVVAPAGCGARAGARGGESGIPGPERLYRTVILMLWKTMFKLFYWTFLDVRIITEIHYLRHWKAKLGQGTPSQKEKMQQRPPECPYYMPWNFYCNCLFNICLTMYCMVRILHMEHGMGIFDVLISKSVLWQTCLILQNAV